MSVYTKNIFDAYLDKSPKYTFPESPKRAIRNINNDDLKPYVSEILIHHHGNQSAIVLEGKNLWFCHQVSFRGHKVKVAASDVSGTSIQFNIAYESTSQKCSEETVTLRNFFSSKPVIIDARVTEKVQGIMHGCYWIAITVFTLTVPEIQYHHKARAGCKTQSFPAH